MAMNKSSFVFIYGLDRFAIGAGSGTSVTKTINLGSHDFWIYYINGKATDGDALKVQLTISNEGEQLSNVSVLFNSIVGTAQRPFILPEPLILPVNSTLEMVFTNLSASAQTAVDVALIGLKKRTA